MGCTKSTQCDDPATIGLKNSYGNFEGVGDVLEKRFKVDVKLLGSGSYAKVYRAVDIKTKQVVAVKRIDKEHSRRELLDNEITILRRYGIHKHIVRLFAVFETAAEVQLVIEFMPGGELFDVLARMGPYGEVKAAEHTKSLASALEHLHSHNVAHRDLKPENLLLTAKPPAASVLKICDFGLAKKLAENEVLRRPAGTWAYCAPEVLNIRKTGTGSYGTKADVFSVGCLVYIMLAGYHPFDVDGQQTEKQMQENILANAWDFEDSAWDGVSKQAQELITSLLKPNPLLRLNAAELCTHAWTSGASPYGNLSDKIDTEVGNFRVRMRHKKMKAGLIATQVGLGMFEAVRSKQTEAQRRWLMVQRAWREGELIRLAPLTVASTVAVAQRNWLRTQATPEFGSGPRHELAERAFRFLDTDQNGYLNGPELYRLAKIKGFQGSLAEWMVEYRKLCSECGWSEGAGVDYLCFELLLNTQHCSFYSTRKDLLHLLIELDSAANMAPRTSKSPRQSKSPRESSSPTVSTRASTTPRLSTSPRDERPERIISVESMCASNSSPRESASQSPVAAKRKGKASMREKTSSKMKVTPTHMGSPQKAKKADATEKRMMSMTMSSTMTDVRSQTLKAKAKVGAKPKAKSGARPSRSDSKVIAHRKNRKSLELAESRTM